MQHSIIIRVAWGLSVFLLLCAIAFAWASNQRERHFEALVAEAASKASAASAGTATTASSAAAAAAIFEKRCVKCHDAEEIPEWAATLPQDSVGAAAFEFLKEHGKAPETESRIVAEHIAAKGTF